MAKPIMNLDEVAFDDIEENGKYTSKRGSIGRHIGARKRSASDGAGPQRPGAFAQKGSRS